MSSIDFEKHVQLAPSVGFDPTVAERSRAASSPDSGWLAELRRRPVLSCAFVGLMFMLATNNPDAVEAWQEHSRDNLRPLQITIESGRAARHIGFTLLGLWGAWSLVRPARHAIRLSPAFALPLVLLISWAFASELWSVDRGFTAKRLVLLGCLTAGVAAIVRGWRARDLPLLALIGCGMQVLASIPFDLLYAVEGTAQNSYRFSGLQHPNHSGISAVFLLLGSLYFFDRTRLKRFGLLGLVALGVLLASKSRSSLIAGVAAVLLYAAIRCPWRVTLAAAFAGAIGLTTLFALDSGGAPVGGLGDLIHMGRRDAAQTTLTGRPMIWAAAFEVAGDDTARMLAGAGYDSFWTPETAGYVSGRLWFGISEGHCAYLDMFFELGVVGAACFAFLVLGGLIRWTWIACRGAVASHAFCAAVLAFAAVHGMTESTLSDPTFATFIEFGALAFLALRAPRVGQARRDAPGEGAACAS